MKNQEKIQSAHRYITQINELLPVVNILHSRSQNDNVQKFRDLLNHHLSHYGERHTVTLFKEYRLFLQRIALKQSPENLRFCRVTKSGWPKVLAPWEISHKSPIDDIRYVMSFWRVIEVFRRKPEYLVHSIEAQSTADKQLVDDIMQYMPTFVDKSLKKTPDYEGYLVMSNKAGPNGPATISCLEDLTTLRADKDLNLAIFYLLERYVPGLEIDFYKAGSGRRHSKLVLLSDKSCKTRVIAIADWWSNVALSGIHKKFMKTLEKIPSDVTFRQDRIPSLFQGLGNHLYSADMTAFTDRFPRKLESRLVDLLCGAGIGGLWEQVTCDRVFEHPLGGVRYAAGNPMGLLSSWPVSTLTHHAVKHYCADKVGKVGHRYVMLGDDSADTCPKVHKMYREVMDRLGVSTSLSKCTQSEDGYAEFAKRLFSPEGEVTGLPITLLREIKTKPEQFIELVRICRERGYSDSVLVTRFTTLIEKHKSAKLLADLLSLPECVSGAPPLMEAHAGSHSAALCSLSEEVQKDLVTISRNYVFWRESEGLKRPPAVNTIGSQIQVDETHPILVAISNKLMLYLDHGEDEFSIYNEWLKGNYREMAQVPNIDSYRYKNKGHKATKSKYEVLKTLVALAAGDCNIRLSQPAKLSNFELFGRGYPTS